MKKNDVLQGICIDYVHDGSGVVKSENFTFFVRNVLIGEKIEFIVTKLKKTYGYGKCINILTPSIERRVPFCSYYGKCGGCQLQHMSYNEQLLFKQKLVQNNVEKIGGLNVEVEKTIGCSTISNYRNKAQFPVRIDNDVHIGFYRLHSNDIIDMQECKIQSEKINEVMQSIRQLFKQLKMKNVFRHLLIKHGVFTDEIMVVFIAKEKYIPGLDRICKMLVEKHSNIKSIVLNINKRNDNVILGEEEIILYGTTTISDKLNELTFNISSKSFYQVNPVQTKVLYETALKMAAIDKNDHVIDLYCGVGTISLFLAEKAKHVTGIEIVDAAIVNAKENAKINNLNNVDFICSDAAKYASYMAENGVKADVVVVDPPRKGCDELTISSIVKMNPNRVVYVSCDPATLARDMARFNTYGYKAVKVQPVDMFPHSFHIENVCLFNKEK